MWMISSIARIVFPASCYGCKARGTVLCERCLKLTRKSLSSMYPFIYSTFDFRDPLIKRVIHAIKYHNRRDLIGPLIPFLAESLRAIPESAQYVLVPIPMPRLRKLMRGYNQAERIAYELHAHSGLPLRVDSMTRRKSPKRQATIHEKLLREQNQKDTFSVSGDVKDMHILLVDDVTTTGATLLEARKALLKAGAANVLALTLAH